MKNHFHEVRKLRGMSFEKLSELTGIPCKTLQMIEDGEEVTLKTKEVAKLSEVFNVKPSMIFS